MISFNLYYGNLKANFCSGKTSLLNILGSIDRSTSGTVGWLLAGQSPRNYH